MYVSTRANYQKVTAAQAIAMGMVPEGGLFVPETIPTLSLAELKPQMGKSYTEWACWILEKFLDDYTPRRSAIASVKLTAPRILIIPTSRP